MAFNLTGEEFEAIKEAYLTIDTDQSELGLKAMFRAFDRNGDGLLSKDEIKRAWKMFITPDEECAEKEVNEFIARCDINGDGYISYEEFVQGILNDNIPETKGGHVSFV